MLTKIKRKLQANKKINMILLFSFSFLIILVSLGYSIMQSNLMVAGDIEYDPDACVISDSWATVISNVQSGNAAMYPVGCRKPIEMDLNNDGIDEMYTLRVANNSNPNVCATTGYSETACGFVFEFADVISSHDMNSETPVNGWPASSMRTYLNSTVYNALPTVLKEAIIDTNAISGYGSGESSNYTSTDKLYLLSTVEVYGSAGNDTVTTSETRQLDYYQVTGVSSSNYSKVIKKAYGIPMDWFLRSQDSQDLSAFLGVNTTGAWRDIGTTIVSGVSPAFRIELVESDFAADSWETIIENVQTGNTDDYHVGDTKTVDLGTFGVHTLRIANMSTPDSCATTGFSQTACGFVLEFADIITEYELSGSYGSNDQYWSVSNMRDYINNDIYNSLPSVIREAIIPTTVYTGEIGWTTIYTTIDKLYLPTIREIISSSYVGEYDLNTDPLTSSQTRQLDYYETIATTDSSREKKINNTTAGWWLRVSEVYDTCPGFYYVTESGQINWYDYYNNYDHEGLSPAFRIGSSFSTDSWKAIVANVESGNTNYYNVGDTKEINLGTLGTHTIRIANMSTPSECTTTIFSQTACGFVLEFADIITTHSMNSTATNAGSWPASEMRTYINDTIYNALPETLRNAIINTFAISGYGYNEGSLNFSSDDKLYLLSEVELFGSNIDYDTLKLTNTRQLDYYSEIGATSSNGLGIKEYNSTATNWWERSPTYYSSKPLTFRYVQQNGNTTSDDATSLYGVSPAFRLGSPSFTSDSWATVVANVQSGNADIYNVGEVKVVDMGSLGMHLIRVANKSNPTECGGSNYSQTACGFVLEFVDIISTQKMNSSNTNVGGWPASAGRTYVNETVYNALPPELQSGIIGTRVISGHGTTSGETNFVTTDKLYFLSSLEVRGTPSTVDTVLATETRQMDYYKDVANVTASSYSGAIKKSNGTATSWWLRSSSSSTSESYGIQRFTNVHTTGTPTYHTNANTATGVSPAFRIGSAFSMHSWENIVSNVQTGNTDIYDVGDMKIVDMGSLGIHTLRIANKSTPAECSVGGYSQTACGFVLEFADIIDNRNMNNISTNVGSWPSAELRNYINETIYDALPPELRAGIIDTKVVSGHGTTAGEISFVSTDKLYLLSTVEIRGAAPAIDTLTTAETRQLDYYKDVANVTTSNYSGAIKKYNGTASSWWLRSASASTNSDYGIRYFNNIYSNGAANYHTSASSNLGVSPAFRIGSSSSFSTDSWETIISNVQFGDTSMYSVGEEKEVDMGELGIHTLRIANKTTPAACGEENYSQTACGFVLEFSDIITTSSMNDTNTSVGGWKSSAMRTYINTTIYNALPKVLRNSIVNTTTISGHESGVSSNYKSIDKLYLLSTQEVWGSAIDDTLTSSKTRQLDYYSIGAVTDSNYSLAIKQYNETSTSWLLRTANSTMTDAFKVVYTDGSQEDVFGNSPQGVSPAFRIGSAFSTDSWGTIVSNIQTGNTDGYYIGDTKRVSMGSLGIHTIRIANKSTPDECSTAGFSQTACGFVLEFEDIITNNTMYSSATNKGGWQSSSMRTYVNGTIYNALPTNLKKGIVETYTLSGHGSTSGEVNFITTDKLYLLTTVELTGADTQYDTVTVDNTRRLDYYATVANYKKTYNGTVSEWWQRAAHYVTSDVKSYRYVKTDGGRTNANANTSYGVSPAFRISPPSAFTTDSWETIVANADVGNLSMYKVGDTKTIDLGDLGVHTVRVANNSTTDDCLDGVFSETACGFVLEFADIIETQKMKSSASCSGGWPKTTLRTYVNDTVYNAFPEVVKNAILNTSAISGHEYYADGDRDNFYTVDKLYFFSSTEIYGGAEWASDSVGPDRTRQLDYYSNMGVTSSYYINAIKKKGTTNTAWWLRSAYDHTSSNAVDSTSFTAVTNAGARSREEANVALGVSPAFRLGPRKLLSTFSTDSWETILSNIQAGNTYILGSKKTVNMGTLGTHTLRVANNTNSPKCSKSNFSQTACGFVLEFADIITTHAMNSTATNVGGWPATDMRTYVNDVIYNALPEVLRNMIINTKVISDHGSTSGETNFVSVDKLYLLASVEASWGTSSTTLTGTQTRALDYYSGDRPGTLSETSYYLKKRSGTAENWWLRMAAKDNTGAFWWVSSPGTGTGSASNSADRSYGVSPAFRIGIEPSTQFSEDSWETITSNVQSNNISMYKVGDTKEIDLGNLGVHTVRIANKSTPSACSGSDYSQTACGFVLEFVDSIALHRINPAIAGSSGGNGYGNVGSWPASEIRTYLNNTVYNALPEVVRNSIISTQTVSGYGYSSAASNYYSIDKLYLPSTVELYGKNETNDTVTTTQTRQLDYYGANYYGIRVKRYNGASNNLWLRSVTTSNIDDFYVVNTSGKKTTNHSEIENGISPLFRLGTHQPSSFTNDSWETIITNVQSGNTNNYQVGDTKEIDLGSLGTHTLRIANNTTPEECLDSTFSQTACGFVLEFADTITTGSMNSTNTASGGWESSAMRTYINNDIYNSLPLILRQAIINTRTISGYESGATENYITNDKLYLLSTLEVWGEAIDDTVSSSDTKQLDYYEDMGVTTSNYSSTIKEDSEGEVSWLLRSANSDYEDAFHIVYTDGSNNSAYGDSVLGISPAFRLDAYIPPSFSTDSWSTIISHAQSGDTSMYQVGDTKEIDMGTLGIHTLRIANNSNPGVCSNFTYSQTACGFVIEFADVISSDVMNSSDTNTGSWNSSSMRTYLNTTIYNALPEELKEVIIDTRVISGHGTTSGETNFTSIDKLYLLSTAEIWGTALEDTITASDTRQLDYYSDLGVTSSSYSDVKKKSNNVDTAWWLRSAYSGNATSFKYAGSDGSPLGNSAANVMNGISPAFRLGTYVASSRDISYDNTNTGVSCSTAQCMVDFLRDLLS